MRTTILCGLVAALVLPAASPAASTKAAARAAGPPLVPRDLRALSRHADAVLQLQRGAPMHVERTLRAAGGELVSPRLRVWRVPSRRAQALAPRLAVAGVLREVQPDRTLVASDHLTRADPLLPQQWWLSRVRADALEPPGPGKPVTVVDSGLDVSHPEFAGRPDTTVLNAQTVRGEDEFHGTSVSSVVGAPANGLGTVGIYPGAALRSWDASGNGELTGSEVIAGITAAATLGRGVVNLSLGGPGPRDPIEEEAVLDAFDRGVVVVAAVGNERSQGSPPSFPATLPHVLTVASTDMSDRVSFFSSRSRGVDLAAPGEDIPIAVPISVVPSGFTVADGTSFSSPIVAGATAWLWTARPELEKTQVLEIMRRSARDIAPPGKDSDTGYGLLDLSAALVARAPAIDPFEPNDDVSQVRPGGTFRVAKPALTTRSSGRRTLAARLEVFEDPEDVYRAWVPAGRRLVAAVVGDRDVDLQIWRPGTVSVQAVGIGRRQFLLGESAHRGSGRESLEYTNRGRAGQFVYVDVFLRSRVSFSEASYQLTLTTATARR